jgi:hypothetical protein
MIARASTPSHSLTTGVDSSVELALLATDDLLATLLVNLAGVEPELVKKQSDRPCYLGKYPWRQALVAVHGVEQRLLQGKYEYGGLPR